MTNDLIAQARRRYMADNPLRQMDIPTITADGTPSEPWTFPNVGDIQIIGCKLGMEYLAICHDDEAVEEWINTAAAIAKSPEWVGILFANVFRGMNIVIGAMTDRPGLREHLQRQAVDAWTRDFSGDAQ